MVASIKPHRDEVGLADGLMLIGGQWVAAGDGQTWDHRHPATGEHVAGCPAIESYTELKTVLLPFTDEMM